MSESDSNSSIIAQSSRDLFTDAALQQRLRLETERIAQYELNQSSDAFFTAHYPHLIRYKRTLKNQRRKEGEKNSDGKYIFYRTFGKSHRFIRGLIFQEFTGHYYRINRGTEIVNGRVTFPSTVIQLSKTIDDKIYYQGRQVVQPLSEFNERRKKKMTIIITNLSDIESLPSNHLRSSLSTFSSLGTLERRPPVMAPPVMAPPPKRRKAPPVMAPPPKRRKSSSWPWLRYGKGQRNVDHLAVLPNYRIPTLQSIIIKSDVFYDTLR